MKIKTVPTQKSKEVIVKLRKMFIRSKSVENTIKSIPVYRYVFKD